MNERTIRLHTFCSVKGGVGKTTLAIVCAKILAAQGRVPVLLDCDLTGTSLADGLNLRAPKVALHEDGSIDFEAPSTGAELSVDESRSLVKMRQARLQEDDRWKDRQHPPPFLNDILNFVVTTKRVPRMEALFWRHKTDDGIRYLPSSSLLDDVKESIVWFYDEPYAWARAFARVLHTLAEQLPTLTDVVVDLPPGTWGFPHETLNLVSLLHFQDEAPLPDEYALLQDGVARWVPNPFIVSSRDPNDFVPALQYVVRHQDVVPTLVPVVNRSDKGLPALRSKIRERHSNILRDIGLEDKLELIPHVDALGQLFWDGNVDVGQIPGSILKTLRLEMKS